VLNVINANQPPSLERVVNLLWEHLLFLKLVEREVVCKQFPFHIGLVNAQIIADLVALGLDYSEAVSFLEKLELLSIAIDCKNILEGIVCNALSGKNN
jgi:hypothetical protein